MIPSVRPGYTSILTAGLGAIGHAIASIAIVTLGIGPREATGSKESFPRADDFK